MCSHRTLLGRPIMVCGHWGSNTGARYPRGDAKVYACRRRSAQQERCDDSGRNRGSFCAVRSSGDIAGCTDLRTQRHHQDLRSRLRAAPSTVRKALKRFGTLTSSTGWRRSSLMMRARTSDRCRVRPRYRSVMNVESDNLKGRLFRARDARAPARPYPRRRKSSGTRHATSRHQSTIGRRTRPRVHAASTNCVSCVAS